MKWKIEQYKLPNPKNNEKFKTNLQSFRDLWDYNKKNLTFMSSESQKRDARG